MRHKGKHLTSGARRNVKKRKEKDNKGSSRQRGKAPSTNMHIEKDKTSKEQMKKDWMKEGGYGK